MRSLRLVSDTTEAGEPAHSDLPSMPPSSRPSPKPMERKTLPQTAAIHHIFQYAGPRQGTRITVTGSTGSGKTYWQRKVVAYASHRDNLVLIHDAKDRLPQYEGCIRDSIFALARNPAEGNVILFRKEDPERVAKMAWEATERNLTVTLLIDEIMDAMTKPMHWRGVGKHRESKIDEIYRKGRSRGATIIGSTQAPQWWPTTAMTQSDFKIMFRMDTRSLDYAKDSLRLTNREIEVIRKLEIGQFVMVQQGVDWNGVVYGPH